MQNIFLKLNPLKILTILFCLPVFIFSQSVKIKIIETSDLHGAIFPYNFVSDKESQNSLANVHTYVENERKNEDQEVILIEYVVPSSYYEDKLRSIESSIGSIKKIK